MNEELKTFEEQLKGTNKKELTDLEKFEQQMKQSNNPNIQPLTQNTKTKKMKVDKNILLSYVSDATGCGHIRNIFPISYLNSIFGKSGKLMPIITPIFLTQNDILIKTRTIFFQRQMNQSQLNVIKQYKQHQPQFRYKMVYDIDDFIWGKNEEQGGTKEDGVPSYNFGSAGITADTKKTQVEIMNLMDVCCFSTQFLADYAKNVLKVKGKCVVVPNAVPQYFWGSTYRPDKTERIEKLRVIYTGSPTHYHNGKKMLGDWDNSWREWVIRSVKNNEIDFTCLGGLPWFFEEIKKKITVHNWVDSFKYHELVKSCNADVGIMPLVPNNFNHSKSDIKYIEHCADGTPAIGSTFTNGKPSPYDDCFLTLPDNCTVKDIDDMMDKLKEPDFYNDIKLKQINKMSQEGRWLESKENIKTLVDAIL